MLKYKTITGKLYPNPKQKEKIDLTFKMCKQMYNLILFHEYNNYNNYLKIKNTNNISSKKFFKSNKRISVTLLKKSNPDFKLVDSLALQYEEKHIFNAFNRYFHTSAKKPKFKKSSNINSYTTRTVNNNIKFNNKYIKLPKLGMIRIRGITEKYLNLDVCIVKITEEKKGKYYATLILKQESILPNKELTKQRSNKVSTLLVNNSLNLKIPISNIDTF